MGISSTYRYRINGVIDTRKTVLQNLDTLCGSCQSWLTYDVSTGQWAVVINEPGSSVASFDDTNILGGVQVQGTGLGDLYNSVRVQFPHVDLRDQPDFVTIAIPDGDRNANEPDNELLINLDTITDPVQALELGLIQLKQSRIDLVATFTVDWSYLNLKAGDLIDITNSVLGWTNKMFRIVTIEEQDTSEGAIELAITALEYDAAVYDLSDLYRYEVTNENGIVTIGQIDDPDEPTLTVYQKVARPNILIEATVPSGIVTQMEFWLSTDGTLFELIGTVGAPGGVFAFGDSVTWSHDKVDSAASYWIKVRARNDTTASDYSPVAFYAGFTPLQTTQAIGNSTQALDASGNPYTLLAALPLLLRNLDGLNSGNLSPGSPGGNIAQSMATSGFMISAAAGQGTVGNIAQSVSNTPSFTTIVTAANIIPQFTGTYILQTVWDQNTSGAAGGRGPYWGEDEDIFRVRQQLYRNTGGNTLIANEGSGGLGSFFWTDLVTSSRVTLTAGYDYTLLLQAQFYTESDNITDGNVTVNYNLYTVL